MNPLVLLLLYINPLTLFVLFLLAYKSPRPLSWAALAVGLPCDILFNLTWGSLLFLEFPCTVTFTQRLAKTKTGNGWRGLLADLICHSLLNRFVAGHFK